MKSSRIVKFKQKDAKKSICSVTITCDEPDQEGNMSVNMTYEGDRSLASFLLQGALISLSEEEEEDNGEFSKEI